MSETIATKVQPAIHAPGTCFHARASTTGPRINRSVVSVTGAQAKRVCRAGVELALTPLLYPTRFTASAERVPCATRLRDASAVPLLPRHTGSNTRAPCVAKSNAVQRARGKRGVRWTQCDEPIPASLRDCLR